MKGVFERLDNQHNLFVDHVIQSFSDDPELFASITAVEWDGDKGVLLIRVEPVSVEAFEDLKDSAIERIRAAALAVPFSCACRVVNSQGLPNMVFKIQQKDKS